MKFTNIAVSLLDGNNQPMLDDNGRVKVKRVSTEIKSGEVIEGEALEVLLGILAVVQQLFSYYSENCQNAHVTSNDKKK